MMYVVVCYNGMGRCIKASQSLRVHSLSAPLQRTDVCYLPCHFISDTFAGIFLFKMELSIPLLFIF